jgi:stalled ribosome rescue protein Dom34
MEKMMKKEVGLWIDHRKTVIVTIENEVEVTREIRSNIEKHVRFSSGSHSKDPNRQYGDHLASYYEGIISLIRDAEAIWIFGPGEAKVELENRLKHENFGEHIVGVETVDKMTDRQIAAKVRDRFLR